MSSKTIVTDIGKALIAKATAEGTTVKMKYFAVGDGAGQEYTPTGHESKLVKENWRANIGSILVNPKDSKELFIDTPIPEDVGGWWIREYGVFDDQDNLILIGTPNPFYKSKAEEGDILVVDFNLSLTLQNIASIEFSIDPKAYVTHEYLENADYPVNGKISYKQRPQLLDSEVATLKDIDGIKVFPDIQDDGKGTVTVQQPNGKGAVMRFLSVDAPEIYTEIDGELGEVRIHGGKLTGYKS